MKRKPETTTAKANAKKQRDNNQNLIENIIKTKPTKNAKLKQKELESEGIDFGSDMFRSRIMSPPVRMYNTGLAYDQDINNSKFEPDLFSDDGGQQQPPLSISEPPDHLAIDTRIQLHPLQIQPTRSIPAPSEPASRWPPSPLAHCPVLKSCATVRAHAHAHGQLTVCARLTLGCARLRNCADGVQAGGQGERRDGGLLTACFEEIGAAAARREKH